MYEGTGLGQVSAFTVSRTVARSTRLKKDTRGRQLVPIPMSTTSNVPVRHSIILWTGLGGLRSPEAYIPALCPGASWNYN